MTKDEWCDIWKIPAEERDAAWEAKCAMDARTSTAPRVMGDIPDFVSPIDGTIVKGRKGLRDHCARHDVVPTAELAGLPIKTMNQQHQSSQQYREETKRTIAEVINSRNYH